MLLLFLAACGSDRSSNNSSTKPRSSSTKKATAKKVSGHRVFMDRCSVCHGANGQLQLNGAKDLRYSTYTVEERIAHIENGKGTMPAFKNLLSKAEIDAVAEYTMKFKQEYKT